MMVLLSSIAIHVHSADRNSIGRKARKKKGLIVRDPLPRRTGERG
jgi:hypothetical protein